MKIPDSKSLFLIGVGFLVPMLASYASRKIAAKGYKLITKNDPPRNPANLSTAWKEALIWGAVSGVIGGVSRLSARRLLSETIIPSEGDDMEDEIDGIA